jgi:hypothetical protein
LILLTLRPTGLSSPAFADWLDYVIVEDGRDVGRVYEDRNSLPELRWFWSINGLRQSEARHYDERTCGQHGLAMMADNGSTEFNRPLVYTNFAVA